MYMRTTKVLKGFVCPRLGVYMHPMRARNLIPVGQAFVRMCGWLQSVAHAVRSSILSNELVNLVGVWVSKQPVMGTARKRSRGSAGVSRSSHGTQVFAASIGWGESIVRHFDQELSRNVCSHNAPVRMAQPTYPVEFRGAVQSWKRYYFFT